MEESFWFLIFYRTETLAHVFWLPSSSTELHLVKKVELVSQHIRPLGEGVAGLCPVFLFLFPHHQKEK